MMTISVHAQDHGFHRPERIATPSGLLVPPRRVPPSDCMAMAAVKKILGQLPRWSGQGRQQRRGARPEMAIASVVVRAWPSARRAPRRATPSAPPADHRLPRRPPEACALHADPGARARHAAPAHQDGRPGPLLLGLKDADDLIAFIGADVRQHQRAAAPLALWRPRRRRGIDELVQKTPFKSAIIHNIPGDITEPKLAEMLRSIL